MSPDSIIKCYREAVIGPYRCHRYGWWEGVNSFLFDLRNAGFLDGAFVLSRGHGDSQSA